MSRHSFTIFREAGQAKATARCCQSRAPTPAQHCLRWSERRAPPRLEVKALPNAPNVLIVLLDDMASANRARWAAPFICRQCEPRNRRPRPQRLAIGRAAHFGLRLVAAGTTGLTLPPTTVLTDNCLYSRHALGLLYCCRKILTADPTMV
jgi:hypothetical protein